MRVVSPKVVALFLVAFAGCSDSSGPRTQSTRVFELVTLGGQPLPAVADSFDTRWDTVLWDSLTLDLSTSTGREISRTRSQFQADTTQVHTDSVALFFVIHGNSIEIGPTSCPSVCATRAGHINASSLTLKIRLDVTPNPESVYRLVAGMQ